MNDIQIGAKFNHWTVVDDKPVKIHRKSGDIEGFVCECDCYSHRRKPVDKYGLLSGHSKSCGCIRRKTHGMAHTKFYQQYYGMIKRCYLISHKEYLDYGGRGISVCKDWKDNFESFHKWSMENGYRDGLTIDKINVNGNYEPLNCRWISLAAQMNNKRNNIEITFNGETLNLKQWSKRPEVYISYGTLLRRYHDGWAVENILFKEIKR